MNLSLLSHYPGLDENEDRTYRNFNILVLIGLLDVTFIGLGLLRVEPVWPFFLCVLEFVFFVAMLLLHMRGYFMLARFTTFLLTICLQAAASIVHGRSAGFDLLFFIIGVLPFLFFDNRFVYGSLFFLTLITHLAVQYVYAHFDPILVIDSPIPLYWNTFVTGVLIFFVIHLFKQGYLKTQKSLKEQNQQILHQKEEIEGINNNLEQLVIERTHRIVEHEKLFIEFAHINAHRVRGPLARILGLLKVIDLETEKRQETTTQVLPAIKANAVELNEVLKEVDTMLNSASLFSDGRRG